MASKKEKIYKTLRPIASKTICRMIILLFIYVNYLQDYYFFYLSMYERIPMKVI